MSKLTITLDHNDGSYARKEIDVDPLGIYEAMTLLYSVFSATNYNIHPDWARDAYIAYKLRAGVSVEEISSLLEHYKIGEKSVVVTDVA